MKQRRFAIITFLMIAITIISVGFAALNDNLLFDGSANVNTDQAQAAFDANVYFSECSVSPENTGKDTASIISSDIVSEVNDTIQFNIASLGLKGDTAEVYGTIANKSLRFDASIKLNNIAIGGADAAMFEVKCYEVNEVNGAEITATNGITVAKSTDVDGNDQFNEGDTLSTKRVKIVVTLKDSPNASAFSATIAVRLDVTAVEPA